MSYSLIDFAKTSKKSLLSLFEQSLSNKRNFTQSKFVSKMVGTAGLLFFEPSTRTRFSFQTACARQGVHPLVLDSYEGTSLEKGESIEDTILNLAAMKPLFFVIRCSDTVSLAEIVGTLKVPVINAGWGVKAHPTQALLDAVTLVENWGDLSGKKVLFVGDVLHSRVFGSHLELAKILGYEIAVCAPSEYRSNELSCTYFDDLDTAMDWAEAVIVLRVQNERHHQSGADQNRVNNYAEKYGMNTLRLKRLKQSGLLLHPGPINYGVELEKEVLKDSRSVVLQLVENGVFIREAIIQKILSGETI